MILAFDIFLMLCLAIVAVAIARLQNLFATIVLTGIFSLLSAALFLILDAVDVAFTEAAVGAGISTVLMLGTLALTADEEKPSSTPVWGPLVVVCVTGAALVYASFDMPAFGDPDAPIHRHLAPHFIEDSATEIDIPNIVTSILASYRGYDTLGETAVVFTAGIAVLALLHRAGRGKGDRR